MFPVRLKTVNNQTEEQSLKIMKPEALGQFSSHHNIQYNMCKDWFYLSQIKSVKFSVDVVAFY